MEETFPFYFPVSASLLSLVGILFFLLDVALDVWTIVSLYQEGEYVYMAVLIALLLASSILLQVFSWLWYSDPDKKLETCIDKFADKYNLIGPLHIFQLGVFLRCASMVELSIRKLINISRYEEGVAVHLKYDLSILRLFETFSESIPQLVLMITIITQEQELQLFTGFKIVGSLLSIATSVLFYHRDMREFIPEEQKMDWLSSAVFFLWNLFLITFRVITVALFVSVLPCFIAVHFLGVWMLLFLWACREKTNFMDTAEGEWLYRATLGIIWYFSWFNMSRGNIKIKSFLYHGLMGADTVLLLGLWFWKTSVESACRNPLPINPYVLIGALPLIYIIGLLLKLLYYWRFHPRTCKEIVTACNAPERDPELTTDCLETDSSIAETQQSLTGVHKRMRILIDNFY